MSFASFKTKAAVLPFAVAGVMAIALVGSWLWFLRSPAQALSPPPSPAFSQQELTALAGKPGLKHGRDADPYKDEAVKNAIRKQAPELQKPWLAYLAGKPAKTEGTVTLGLTIDPDGRATQVAVVHSDFEHTVFDDGVRKALAGIVFPPPPGGQAYSVTHRLYFKKEQAANDRAKGQRS